MPCAGKLTGGSVLPGNSETPNGLILKSFNPSRLLLWTERALSQAFGPRIIVAALKEIFPTQQEGFSAEDESLVVQPVAGATKDKPALV
jgi:hypothetical protein